MHTQILIRALLVAALSASTATAGLAAGKEGTFGGGKGSGAFLTRAQLRDCINQQAKIKQQDTEMQAQQDKLNADKAEIGKRGDTLKTQLETLDRTSPDAVTAYNEQAAARDKMIDEYQEQVTQFNARVQSFNTDREGFTKNCSNRRYFEDDEIAIRKGK